MKGVGVCGHLLILVLFGTSLSAEPIAQRLYEEHIGRKCDQPNRSELEDLSACLQSPSQHQLSDLDKASEYMVLKPIADCEVTQLTCLANQTDFLLKDANALKAASAVSCGNLPLLGDSIRNQEFLAKRIQALQRTNDRTLRAVPEQEFKQVNQLIQNLKDKLALYKAIEDNIRLNDPLLSSPTVFPKVREKLQTGHVFAAESASKICEFLKTNATQLLKTDLSNFNSSQAVYAEKLSTDTWLQNKGFKRRLWNSACKDDVVKKAAQIPEFQTSTYCRLEGRYGESADIRDRGAGMIVTTIFAELAMLAAPIGGAAGAVASAPRIGAVISRIAAAVNVSAGVAFGVTSAFLDCEKKVSAVSEGNLCTSSSPQAQKSVFYKKLAVGSCSSSAGLALLAVGLPMISVDAGVAGQEAKSLGAELAERTNMSKNLLQRATSTSAAEKLANVGRTDGQAWIDSNVSIRGGRPVITNQADGSVTLEREVALPDHTYAASPIGALRGWGIKIKYGLSLAPDGTISDLASHDNTIYVPHELLDPKVPPYKFLNWITGKWQEFGKRFPAPTSPSSLAQTMYTDLKPLAGRIPSSVEDTLKNGKIVSKVRINEETMTEPYVVTFADGTKGIWKAHLPNNFYSCYRCEVLAYELDRKLGIGMVPATVERTLDGQKGSIQLFVNGTTEQALDSRVKMQRLFDFIIGNGDRSNNNVLVAAGGQPVSIDNAGAFYLSQMTGDDLLVRWPDLSTFLRTPDGQNLATRIRTSLAEPGFQRQMIDYIGPGDTARLVERMRFVVDEAAH